MGVRGRMTEETLEMHISKTTDGFRFVPRGNPIALAARMQDLLTGGSDEWSTGSLRGSYNFRCKGSCLKHFSIKFYPDGGWEALTDGITEDFSKALALLKRNHDLLMHACSACDHPFPVIGKIKDDLLFSSA